MRDTQSSLRAPRLCQAMHAYNRESALAQVLSLAPRSASPILATMRKTLSHKTKEKQLEEGNGAASIVEKSLLRGESSELS